VVELLEFTLEFEFRLELLDELDGGREFECLCGYDCRILLMVVSVILLKDVLSSDCFSMIDSLANLAEYHVIILSNVIVGDKSFSRKASSC